MAFEKNPNTATIDDDKPKNTTPKDGEKAAKKAAPKKPDAKPKSTRKPGPKSLESKLTDTVQQTGYLLIGIGQVHDGIVLYSRAEPLAHAWSQAADQNKQIENFLRRLVEGGVWGGVITASASVVLPIVQNHGIATAIPNPFMLSQEEVNSLPPELQVVIAAYEQAAKAAQEEAVRQAANPTPAGAGAANGAP